MTDHTDDLAQEIASGGSSGWIRVDSQRPVASADTTALIEEARVYLNALRFNTEDYAVPIVRRLVAALEAAEAELRRLREGIQALADGVDHYYIERRLLSLLGEKGQPR